MPTYNQVYSALITAGGGTVNIDVVDTTITRYVFSGSANLLASWTIQPDGLQTPIEGTEVDIRWQALSVIGGNSITIFGRALSADEALSDLTITCYYNGSAWDVDVLNNDLVIDTDTPSPFRGFKRVDSGDKSTLINGILNSGEWAGIINYIDSTGDITRTLYCSPSQLGLIYNRDLGAGLGGHVTFEDEGDGVRGTYETYTSSTSKRYGFSSCNATGAISADFYEYDPVLDLDTKGIFVTSTNIKGKQLYTIVDADNYLYNDWYFDDDEFTFRFGSTVIAGVETLSTKTFKLKLSGTVLNVIPALSSYANSAAADADVNLLSGSLYKLNGDRVVYQKP